MGRKKPEAVKLGRIRAAVMASRGVRGQRWYWRVREGSTTLRGMWATVEEAEHEVARLHSEQPARMRHRHDARVGAQTVDDLLCVWLAAQEPRVAAGRITERTASAYRQRVGLWRGTELAELSLKQVRRRHIEDVMQGMEAIDGLARSTVRTAAAVFLHAWAWGVARELCPALDLRRITPPRPSDAQRVYCGHTPPRADIAAVLDAIPQPQYRRVVRFLALTGARIGEALTVTVGDVDLAARVVHLRGKTGHRAYPLAGELLTMCHELTQGHEPERRLLGMKDPRAVQKSLTAACWAVGVERFTPHGLRRRVVMDLLQVTDPGTVSRLTGHSVQVLLRDYVRPSGAELLEVVQRARMTTERGGKVVQFRAQNQGTDGGSTDE